MTDRVPTRRSTTSTNGDTSKFARQHPGSTSPFTWFSFLAAVLWRRGSLLPIAVAVLGAYDLAVGQIAPDSWRDGLGVDAPQIGDAGPLMPWYGWALAIMLLVTVVALSGSKREIETTRSAARRAQVGDPNAGRLIEALVALKAPVYAAAQLRVSTEGGKRDDRSHDELRTVVDRLREFETAGRLAGEPYRAAIEPYWARIVPKFEMLDLDATQEEFEDAMKQLIELIEECVDEVQVIRSRPD